MNIVSKISTILILSLFLFFASYNSAIGEITNNDIHNHNIINTNQKYFIELFFNPFDYRFSTENTQQGTYAHIELTDEGFNLIQGRPKLPTIRRFVEIPADAQPEITILDLSWEHTSLDELNLPDHIIPSQSSKEKIPQIIKEFSFDKEFYLQDSFFPENIAKIVEIGNIRSHRFVLIEISPVLYNPSNGKLKLMRACDIRIDCLNSNIDKTIGKINKYYSQRYENYFENIFINYGSFENTVQNVNKESYLMIVYDDFIDEMLPLVELKQNLNFDVITTKTSEIPGGPTKENIRNYIEDAYNNWENPPMFVLLVGDTEHIPAYTGTACYSATDLKYVTVDGDDFIPDIFIGRFPASDETHVSYMVEKTLFYELGNFSSNDWIKKAAFIASDDYFWITEEAHNYIIDNHLVPINYTCDMLYSHTYEATTQDVTDAINSGRSLVIYSGHGFYDSWTDGPPYSRTDVERLMNENMYPFVCSFACKTNAFDKDECFGKTWVCQEDKAALAYWGASSDTYWEEDNVLEIGLFTSWLEDGMYWIGGMTDGALLYLYENYSGGNYSRYYFEAYNVIGDPSVEIWNDNPNRAPFEPDHPIGPNEGLERVEHLFTASTVDFEDQSLYYMFDWGDNTNSGWYGPYNSSEIVEVANIWTKPGVYHVRVKAKDELERESFWSESHTITIIDNLAPLAPIITGKTIGNTGEQYELTISSVDPEGQKVLFYIDWGDGVKEFWLGPNNSSVDVVYKHKFRYSGSMTIVARAKDILDEQSSETTFNVYIVKNRGISNKVFLQNINRIID